MCRHIGYLGPATTLGSVLVDPPWSLLRQSWAPRQQSSGTVNADGFGVGWYADGDPMPARYRRDRPVWSDSAFADLARVVRTRAFVAAVRSATPGMVVAENASAPFTAGRWLFSHNGAVEGYPGSAGKLAEALTPARLLTLEAASDSALLWGLLLDRLEAGADLPDAVADLVTFTLTHCQGRLNLLVSDGTEMVATAIGNSLSALAGDGFVVLASEPYDQDPRWAAVPDQSLVLATPDQVQVLGL
jgi:gamma-glutamyl hercynylcysteine S-oxide hydrolase